MNILRPISTSARLTFVIAAAYLLLFFVVGAGVYYKVSAQLESDTRNFVVADAQELRSMYALNGADVLLAEVITRTADPDERDMFYSVIDAQGQRLAGQAPPVKNVPTANRWLSFRLDDASRTRVIAHTYKVGDWTLISGMQTRAEDGFLQTMLRAAWMSLLFAALLSVLTAWLISKWITVRVRRLSDTARVVAAGQLGRRVDVDHSGDAFDGLGIEINNMLDRIEELIGGVRQVSDQIAHDLRTPLTHLRNDLVQLSAEVAQGRPSLEHVQTSIAKTDQLLATFTAILRLSKLEFDPIPDHVSCVALDALCRDAIELYAPLAQARQIRVHTQLVAVEVKGERDQLFQMLINLIDNAIKYSPEGGRITLSTELDTAHAHIRVIDGGEGIRASDCARVFNRFERLEAHRGTHGNGLGLSLVRAVVARHHGTVQLGDAHPGLIVEITLPGATAPV